jgi:hypothetical protein
MTVDPLRSDPMAGICSPPLPLSSSFGCLDVDLMVQISSNTVDLMVVVAPPPELLISSDLEEFVSVQRFWPLNFLLRTRLSWVSSFVS